MIHLNDVKLCAICNSPIESRRAKIYCGTSCRNKGIAKNRRDYKLEGSPTWKGGRKLDSTGYVLVKDPKSTRSDGYIMEHRLLIEKHLGRELKQDEQVHHIDGDKTNNAIDNLSIMNKSDHMRLHALEKNEWRNRDEQGRYA